MVHMKTTTYILEGGKVTKTVSDKPELTPEQYAVACAVIRNAARRTRRNARHQAMLDCGLTRVRVNGKTFYE